MLVAWDNFLIFLIDLVVSVTTLGQGIVGPDGTPSSVGCGQVKWNLLSSRVSMFAVCWLSKDGPSAYRDLIRGRPLLPPSECRQSAEHMVQMVCGHSVRQTNNRTNQRTACVSWHTKLYKETTLLHG